MGHEADLKKILQERRDFTYVADVPPKNLADLHTLPDGPKRVFVTKKKMGAQTAEANSNAGIQAAQQIVGFFEKGEMRGQVSLPFFRGCVRKQLRNIVQAVMHYFLFALEF